MYRKGQHYRHTAIKDVKYVVDTVDVANEIVYLKETGANAGRPIPVSFSDMKRLYKKS